MCCVISTVHIQADPICLLVHILVFVCVWTTLKPKTHGAKQRGNTIPRQLLHSLRIPKVSGVAWQQAQRWIPVLKWWHLKRRETNLSVRSDDSALKFLKKQPNRKHKEAADCWGSLSLNAAQIAPALENKWKMNEGDFILGFKSDFGNMQFGW